MAGYLLSNPFLLNILISVDQVEKIYIKEITCAKSEDVAPINLLLSQLTSSPVVFEMADLERMVASEASRLFFIYCEGEVAGMLTLGSYLTPTGPKSWVEDVVVDQRFRGHSLGKRLVEYAIAEAAKVRGNQLMLTSKPVRVAANALYRSVGFQPKQTNVYRMVFEEE